ncbi:hypothetical protein N332_00867, partial [Mesitornis unicolor]
LPTAEEDNSGVGINADNSGTFSQTVKMRTEYSQPVNVQGPGMAGEASLLHTEVVLPAEADASPELVQAHFVSENTQSTTLLSEDNGHSQKYQKLQEENHNFAVKGQSGQLHNAVTADEVQELEKVFSANVVPINYPHSAQ